MRTQRPLAIGLAIFVFTVVLMAVLTTPGNAQTWTALAHQPPAPLGTALLLTDGTVMAQGMATSGYGTGNWYRLTPTSANNYVNGTWTQLASMPSGYSPLYYSSAVLPDGRVVTVGGEYNNNAEQETNLGAIYNPATNTWASITPALGLDSHRGCRQRRAAERNVYDRQLRSGGDRVHQSDLSGAAECKYADLDDYRRG